VFFEIDHNNKVIECNLKQWNIKEFKTNFAFLRHNTFYRIASWSIPSHFVLTTNIHSIFHASEKNKIFKKNLKKSLCCFSTTTLSTTSKATCTIKYLIETEELCTVMSTNNLDLRHVIGKVRTFCLKLTKATDQKY